MSSDKATAKGSLLGARLPKEQTTRVAKFIQLGNLRSKMSDDETQAGSPPVVVLSPNEQSLRDHFEHTLLISEEAAATLAEQVMEVFTEKEEQAQQLTGRCPSLLEATIEELIILLEAEPIGRRKSKSWQESSVMPLCIAHITTAYSAFIAAEFEKVRNLAVANMRKAEALQVEKDAMEEVRPKRQVELHSLDDPR